MSGFSHTICCRILEVSPGASQDEIREAYYSKARQCHPDRNQDDPEATEKFQRLSRAYHTLTNAKQRHASDFFHTDSHSDSDSDSEFTDMFGRRSFFDPLDFFLRIFQEMLWDQMREEEIRRRRMFEPDWYGFNQTRPRPHYARPTWTEPSSNHQSSDRYSNIPRSKRNDKARPAKRNNTGGYRAPEHSSTNNQNPSGGTKTSSPGPTDRGRHPQPPRRMEKKTKEPACKKAAPAYVVPKPPKPSKKDLLAEQNRRQSEADKIGKELRAKAKKNAQLKSEMAGKKGGI